MNERVGTVKQPYIEEIQKVIDEVGSPEGKADFSFLVNTVNRALLERAEFLQQIGGASGFHPGDWPMKYSVTAANAMIKAIHVGIYIGLRLAELKEEEGNHGVNANNT